MGLNYPRQSQDANFIIILVLLLNCWIKDEQQLWQAEKTK